MHVSGAERLRTRYQFVTEGKAGGVTYTPKDLADFVARRIVEAAELDHTGEVLRVLDPAVGEGQLLASLLEQLPSGREVEICGFDTNTEALAHTEARLRKSYPKLQLRLATGDFLGFVLEKCGGAVEGGLFKPEELETFDLIIANPPYVRTQIMGAGQARKLAAQFGLTGRVDLYYAFILAMAKVLSPRGVAGIIVSNRFMTTKAGASVRRAIRSSMNLRHVWDLGDTKVFDAAVLPAVLLAGGRSGKQPRRVPFTSIYETRQAAEENVPTLMDALRKAGVVNVPDGRSFRVQHGTLDESRGLSAVWRVATEESDAWLATVQTHTWRTFRDVGKVRVGVKTCADRVFIRTDWATLPEGERPELLRPLTTHHIARPFKPAGSTDQRQILYPHQSVRGRCRAIDLSKYLRSKVYLEQHRAVLENRRYVLEAGRNWYEIWVPQDPAAWDKTKLVFRDISERPCFWVDQEGSVVNGDCYWMMCERAEEEELLWMAAAVGNSTFVEAFYDHRFNNKLYAGRRRFITQYVEEFPLPNAETKQGEAIIAGAKAVYEAVGTPEADRLTEELDRMVWQAFGLSVKEVAR